MTKLALSGDTTHKSKLIPILALLFVMVIWGLSFLSIKYSMSVVGPMTLAILRFIIASAILFTMLRIREPATRLLRADLPLMALSGIIGITIYFFFENNGVKLTTVASASILIASIPVLTILADCIFCGSRFTITKVLGGVLSFGGVYLLVRDSGQFDFSSQNFMGNLLILGAALAWVAYSILTRPLHQKYSRLAITTYQTLCGTVAIIPFLPWETNYWPLLNGVVVANILFLGVFCSALGYYIYVYAIDRLGVALSSLFINIVPVVTVLAGYLILDEKITSSQIIGGGVIIFAVLLADIGSWFKIIIKKEVSQLSSEHASQDQYCSQALPEGERLAAK